MVVNNSTLILVMIFVAVLRLILPRVIRVVFVQVHGVRNARPSDPCFKLSIYLISLTLYIG